MSAMGASLLRIAICEKCSTQMGNILVLLNKYVLSKPDMEICPVGFDSGDKLLESLSAGNGFDLLLIDALILSSKGIRPTQTIKAENINMPTIFMVLREESPQEGFYLSDSMYIFKPVREEELFPALDKSIITPRLEDEKFFIFSTQDKLVRISFPSIVCVELFGRTIHVHLENGTTLTSKSIRTSFETAVSPLLQDKRFLHAHKSFILNMAFVEELTAGEFIMKHNLVVPVPKHKYAAAKARYLSYVSGRGIVVTGCSRYLSR